MIRAVFFYLIAFLIVSLMMAKSSKGRVAIRTPARRSGSAGRGG